LTQKVPTIEAEDELLASGAGSRNRVYNWPVLGKAQGADVPTIEIREQLGAEPTTAGGNP
jgi:hypothetical protein